MKSGNGMLATWNFEYTYLHSHICKHIFCKYSDIVRKLSIFEMAKYKQ